MDAQDRDRQTGRTTRQLLACFREAMAGVSIVYVVQSRHFARWCLWLIQRAPFPPIAGVVDNSNIEVRFAGGGHLAFRTDFSEDIFRGQLSRVNYDHAALKEREG